MIPIQEMTVSLARVDLVGSSLLSPTQDPGPAEATFLDSSGPGSHPCTWTTHPRCPRPSPVRTSRYSPARVLFPPSVAFFHCCSAELPTLNPSCHLLPGALLVPIPAPSPVACQATTQGTKRTCQAPWDTVGMTEPQVRWREPISPRWSCTMKRCEVHVVMSTGHLPMVMPPEDPGARISFFRP